MTKSNLKVPCKCGHSRINHSISIREPKVISCAVWACECADYKSDNLKWLENEYERKSK